MSLRKFLKRLLTGPPKDPDQVHVEVLRRKAEVERRLKVLDWKLQVRARRVR